MNTQRRVIGSVFMLAVVGTTLPASAETAVDLGVTAGVVQVVDTTRYAVTPQLRMGLLAESGWGLTLRGAASVVLPQTPRDVIGIHGSLQAGAVHAWETLTLDLSAALAGYRLTACNVRAGACGVVVGLAPGIAAAGDYFFAWEERVGVRLAASAWAYLGDAPVVSGTYSFQAQAGLVVRLTSRR